MNASSGQPATGAVVTQASHIDRDARSLTLRAGEVADEELAKQERLETLVINGGSASRIDLRGLRNLTFLQVSHVRGLAELIGVEDLTTLEELDLYGLPRLRTLPSLSRLTNLWRLELGSMKGFTAGLAPFVAAPNLREVQLQSTFVLAPGDPELVRDHQRLVGLSWFDARGTTAAEVRRLFAVAGRRPALMRTMGRPPEHEVPATRLAELAPEHMVQITVSVRGEHGQGQAHPISGLGAVLLEGECDYGPGLRSIRITLCQGAHRLERTRIKVQQAKGVVSIEHPSDLPEDRLHQDAAAGPTLFEQGAREVVAALEAARPRVVADVRDFAIDALLAQCRQVADNLPSKPEALDALIERAETHTAMLRVARNRLHQRSTGSS